MLNQQNEMNNFFWCMDFGIDFFNLKLLSDLFTLLLPLSISQHPNSQPFMARKHLEFELERLRDTMSASFGTNEQLRQRHDERVQRIQLLDGEMMNLRKHRQQVRGTTQNFCLS